MPLQKETPLICLITKGETSNHNYGQKEAEILDLVKAAVWQKIDIVQIREKQLSAKTLFRLTEKAAQITFKTKTALLVNDRADIALAAGANGVHLTSKSISVKAIRQSFPKDFLIGVSCHSAREVAEAQTQGANFAFFSPIFPTPSKEKYGAPQGIDALREICRLDENFPVIALGGIDEYNFHQTLEAGARGIAAIRLFSDVERLPRIAGKIREFKTQSENSAGRFNDCRS